MPNLYPTFNILTCLNISLVKFKLLLNWYYLLTSFLHIGYLEKCVTTRIYPGNCFVPLPALTDVWNWALRPQHSDWVPKIRQINFTNVIFTKTIVYIVILNHPIFCTLGVPGKTLTHFLFLPAAQKLLPSPRLSCCSSRVAEVQRNPWKPCSPAQRRACHSGLLRAASRWVSCISTPQPVLSLTTCWHWEQKRRSNCCRTERLLPVAAPREKGSTD